MEFRIQKQTREFVESIYKLKFPKDEKYNLESQLKRASVSISLDIREGNTFKGKNRKRFFNENNRVVHKKSF